MMVNDVTVTARLLSQAARGNHVATVQLFDGELEEMYETACLLLGGTGDALEMVRDSVCAAVDKLGEVKDPARFSSWARNLVVNRALQHMVERREPFLDADSTAYEPMAEEWCGDGEPGEVLELFLSTVRPHQIEADGVAPDSFRRMLRLQLQSLPDDLRIAFVLHDILGFRVNGTSVLLGQSPGVVKNLLAAARHTLVMSVSTALRSMAAVMGGSDDWLKSTDNSPAQHEIGAC
ncbi:MAG: sigma factor-like helix-turn-helix DNA-binding protein [Terriglobia bacterium]|jgi:RNA polymerase sigma-70 factor (ECF subfamily)|nr:sigma factor-like helix-turn-helix DNA-binding protein [Terriglobia bacterium]